MTKRAEHVFRVLTLLCVGGMAIAAVVIAFDKAASLRPARTAP